MGQTTALEPPVFMLFAGVIGMLILAISVIVFFLIYQKRLSGQQEAIRGLEVAYQKELLQSSLEAQESERKRIASDLHDSVGSTLSAIRLYLNQLKQESDPGYYQNLKQETTGLIDNAIANIRAITRNLLPPSLEQFGLIAALEDLCRRMNDLDFIEVEFQCPHEQRFSSQLEVAVYRVVQELLNNTLKHAAASRIRLQLQVQREMLKLIYEDNGQGFKTQSWKETVQHAKGLGLKSIESRLNFLNAGLEYQSEEGKGVRVNIEIPLVPERSLNPA